ncbi:MAG: anti-sigma factor [Hyphomicrobiales bacterium]|jgi:anti-sigma factor RsiW|nr:anti-sigma factor [Hyphomicrobiales bacterium]
MTDPNIPVTEDELHAFVDDELPAERRADVEAWLKAHPDDAERVRSWRSMAELLHARYDAVAEEPVPQRLELERLTRQSQSRPWIYGAVAAALVAFLAGGSIGWLAHGASTSTSSFQTFALDALDAHRTYVVEVRHPVEVEGSDRAHLQQWLSKRVGYTIKAPDLESAGLKLVGGRLLPGPDTPAAFFMYETPSGERFTLYTSRARTDTTSMRFAEQDKDGAMFWADKGVGYVVSGTSDKARLNTVARAIYDQTDKAGG